MKQNDNSRRLILIGCKKKYSTLSFKDFENIPDLDIFDRASSFNHYLDYLNKSDQLNYRLENISPCGPELFVNKGCDDVVRGVINFVSNDYLGLTQHPAVKLAAMQALEKFGTGSGASPAIGGHFNYHQDLEIKIASFFKREAALLYTTGYTANSATLQCLLKKEDIAIVDMGVHASVYEGCLHTNVKSFVHNDLERMEEVLIRVKDAYRTKMVIVDGVYSQDGDLAPLREISYLTKKYGAVLMVDDAHGIGVIGPTGRGLIEKEDVFDQVDIISGTFSKSLAGIGGFVVARPEIIRFLKFQARQHLFSAAMPPSTTCAISRAIELIDEESHWIDKLRTNVNYFKSNLLDLGFVIGNTQSAIIPVKIGDPALTAQAAKFLFDAGIYANCIIYPAVSRKDARIRMSLMATHTQQQLDNALDAFELMKSKLPVLKQ
ncbi:aminotransferase class I/II-fold pyridoxal phosphate-dependent enzyme [Sphingobacterium deserti]|uniref:2-amino-3-ketobutyrate CoA ligase n=1 Tax=Sphingobacterium deserti TaxID=1229276 RepID=A0A0B8TBK8_9SPHI|nr:aminotransferase class I/II-fold pyridoxal phosphate-dependent enzyme [Sphingobacterium deserti]KGE15615.1 2-amino-3-ketobutyrate CoA ligase [Sphingobacterium deserti]